MGYVCGMHPQNCLDDGHDDGGGQAVPGSVADEHAPARRVEREEVVQVCDLQANDTVLGRAKASGGVADRAAETRADRRALIVSVSVSLVSLVPMAGWFSTCCMTMGRPA